MQLELSSGWDGRPFGHNRRQDRQTRQRSDSI